LGLKKEGVKMFKKNTKFQKFFVGLLAAVALLAGSTIQADAATTGRRVIVDAALIFHRSGDTAAAGQVHRNTTFFNPSALVNGRRQGTISHGTASNGWGGHVMWVHGSTLGDLLNILP